MDQETILKLIQLLYKDQTLSLILIKMENITEYILILLEINTHSTKMEQKAILLVSLLYQETITKFMLMHWELSSLFILYQTVILIQPINMQMEESFITTLMENKFLFKELLLDKLQVLELNLHIIGLELYSLMILEINMF